MAKQVQWKGDMSSKRELEMELDEFFEKHDRDLTEYKKKALMELLEKYLHFEPKTVKLTSYDLKMIRSLSSDKYRDEGFPKFFNNSDKIDHSEAVTFCLIDSTISYLRSLEVFKKLPKFDLKTTED